MDESNIPIDINIGKLQDWLVSRRHVNKEWQKNIIAVREKINNSIQDMPVHDDIATLLSGSYINYFHCLKIIEILKQTEADTKNIFGRYGSQRMKDWLDVVKSYEKENLYLGEAAQMLVRNMNYEIPGMKKQIAKEEQIQLDCEKKHLEYLKNEASSKSEFLTLCKQLGIEGNKIKKELVERLQELPEIYDKIGQSLKPILPAIELYSAFTKYVLGDEAPQVLPLLQYMVEHGNTTVYEWMYGEAPLSVELDPIHIEVEDDKAAGDQIDFGDGAIDFGDIDTSAIDFGEGDAGGEIDWGNIEVAPTDVDVSADVAAISLEESGIVVEEAGLQGGVATGREALTLLDNPTTSNQLVEQLLELESFLKMRVYESSAVEQSFSLVAQLPGESAGALAGLLADCAGCPALVCAGFYMLCAPVLLVYQRWGATSYLLNMALLVVGGVLVNGPYALITTAVSADLGTHSSLAGDAKALATVTAIIDGTGSIGAAIGPMLAGVVSSSGSWSAVFYMLISCDLLALCLLLRIVKSEVIKLRQERRLASPRIIRIE